VYYARKNRKSLLRAAKNCKFLRKVFQETIDSSLRVYYTKSELERRRRKIAKRTIDRI